jgi:predicted nucleotidyltransferase
MQTLQLAERIEPLVNEFVERVRAFYGERLVKIILFGSYARGDFHDESDVDLLVVLRDEDVSNIREKRAGLSRLTWELFYEYGLAPSAFVVTRTRFEQSSQAFFRFIRQEGITIYE